MVKRNLSSRYRLIHVLASLRARMRHGPRCA
jgi:hypothetical protein